MVRKYKGEMYFDVVDIVAYSLIFSRPWQYDVDVKHLVRDNLYKIIKNYMNYTLIPLKGESNLKASKVEGKAFIVIISSELEMQTEVRETRQIHAMLIKAL
jgi:hypothetical protein